MPNRSGDHRPRRAVLSLAGPIPLGHENVGWVAQTGPGVTDLSVGESVVVHGAGSCGSCEFCLIGRDNFCVARPLSYGMIDDGGLAPLVLAKRRDVVPIGDLDHRSAAPLGDAGATAFGAVHEIQPHVRDNGFVVVIGVGGVGSLAVQLVRLLTSAEVIAVDHENRLDLAARHGAHHLVVSDSDSADKIKKITGPLGADAVIDDVGTDTTLRLAAQTVRPLGAVAVVGTASGTVPFGFVTQAYGARLFTSITCSLSELQSLYKLANRGLLTVDYQAYSFDEISQGYDDLRAGRVAGRPVVLFDGTRPGNRPS